MLLVTTSEPVLIIGTSGFVGGRLAEAFLAEGQPVRGLARDPSQVKLAHQNLEIVRGDMLDPATLKAALTGTSAVYVSVHTLSRQSGPRSGDYMDLEKSGLENIVRACQDTGVRRLVYVTFIGAAPDAASSWLRGRWDIEQYLLGTGLDVTILHPGMIVGIGGQGFNGVLANARRSRATVIGSGQLKMRPIAVADLTGYLVRALAEPQSYGQAFDVGSDEVLSMDEMIDIAAECLGHKHPRKLHLPHGFLRAAAPLVERLGRLPKGSMSGAVSGMEIELVGDPTEIRRVLPGPLRTYRQAVRDELARPA